MQWEEVVFIPKQLLFGVVVRKLTGGEIRVASQLCTGAGARADHLGIVPIHILKTIYNGDT